MKAQEVNAMTIRPYLPAQDFAEIRQWQTDERTHALWCANRFPYPLTAEGFAQGLQTVHEQCGDDPYLAVDETGTAVGFFCRSMNAQTKEAMLKFVIVDPRLRGQGIGTAMLRAAVEACFAETGADAVQLMVFAENAAAKHCYQKVGFRERSLTPEAFRFRDEAWRRCNMIVFRKEKVQKDGI